MEGNVESGVMVKGFVPGIWKLIKSGPAALFASMMACRKEPAPLSPVFRTVNVAGKPSIGDRNNRPDSNQKSRPNVDLNNLPLTTGESCEIFESVKWSGLGLLSLTHWGILYPIQDPGARQKKRKKDLDRFENSG